MMTSRFLGVALGVLSSLAACSKRESSQSAAATSASAQKPQPGVPVAQPYCNRSAAPRSYTIAAAGTAPTEPDGGGEDDAEFLPFAIELGKGLATAGVFAASGLRAQAGANHALLVTLTAEPFAGRSVDLGRVFGDVDPPLLAADRDGFVVGVIDSEPNGRKLRLGRIAPPFEAGSVTWGGELSYAGFHASAVDLALGAQRGVVVWEELDKKTRRSMVQGAGFAVSALGDVSASRPLTPEDSNAEAPRVARRPGGFWLAYLTAAPPSRAGGAPKRVVPAREEAADLLVDFGPRALAVVSLDDNGAPVSRPLLVTAADAHVLVFDVVEQRGGGLVLAWRDDAASPGVERRTVHVATVKLDGTMTRHVLEDEELGAGAPSLIADVSRTEFAGWLSIGGVNDVTRLVPLDGAGRPVAELSAEPALGSAEPLASARDRLLIARPHGLAVDLELVSCARGGAPPPPPR